LRLVEFTSVRSINPSIRRTYRRDRPRIMKVAAAPEVTPWLWTLAFSRMKTAPDGRLRAAFGNEAEARPPRAHHSANSARDRGRGDRVKRRTFISLLGGAAVAWPLAARAQQAERVRRIGVLMSLAADDAEGQARLAAFLQGLQQLGWTDGRNVRIDQRWG